jgi:2-oxoglutarate/2-oxoacid ferredoxin oxidoreductase subunit alpha
MVAMNAETYAEDVASLKPGGYLLYDNSEAAGAGAQTQRHQGDRHSHLDACCSCQFDDPKQRQLFKNIVYLGALAALLNIEFDVITDMVSGPVQGQGHR